MPRTKRMDDDEWGIAATVECTRCGLIGICPEVEVVTIAAEHYAQVHPGVTRIRSGRDFTYYPSPLRCDCCNGVAELPYWTHVSDPPTNEGSVVDSDGLWLVCDTCHGFWQRQDLAGWSRHYVAVARTQMKRLEEMPEALLDLRVEIARRYRLLLVRFDEGQRNTVENPGPLRP